MSPANSTGMTYEGSIKTKTKVNSRREVIVKSDKNQTNQPTAATTTKTEPNQK